MIPGLLFLYLSFVLPCWEGALLFDPNACPLFLSEKENHEKIQTTFSFRV